MRNSNNDKSLPWWVEILFVQIGLPDSWLRSFLKTRKRTRLLISNNTKPLWLIIYTGLVLIYCFPIIKQARIHNICVEKSHKIVTSKYWTDYKPNKSELNALATNFCNGGSI